MIFSFYNIISNPKLLIIIHLLLFAAQYFIIIKIKDNFNKFYIFLRYAYPFLFLTFFYIETSYLNRIFFNEYLDWIFEYIDDIIFGFQPALLFHQFVPYLLFKELISIGYLYYYFVIPLTAVYIFLFVSIDVFKEFVFIVVFSFFLYYIAFILVPVAGPHYFYSAETAPAIKGIFFSYIVQFIENNIEVPTGAFPSSHIGVGFISIIYLIKYLKNKYYIVINLFLFLMMTLATVYIGAHYFIDVPFGFLTGYIFFYCGKRIYT